MKKILSHTAFVIGAIMMLGGVIVAVIGMHTSQRELLDYGFIAMGVGIFGAMIGEPV